MLTPALPDRLRVGPRIRLSGRPDPRSSRVAGNDRRDRCGSRGSAASGTLSWRSWAISATRCSTSARARTTRTSRSTSAARSSTGAGRARRPDLRVRAPASASRHRRSRASARRRSTTATPRTRASSTTRVNVLCLGARVIGPEVARELVATFARARSQRRAAPRAPPREGGRARARRARRGPRRHHDGGVTMQLGMIGLGRMGANMVRRLMRDGHDVRRLGPGRGRGRSSSPPRARPAPTRAAISSRKLARAARRLADGARRRRRRRARRPDAAPASAATSSSTAATRTTSTTCAASAALAEQGVHYVDCGVSGGVWGLTEGYGLMAGGDDAAIARLTPMLRSARARRRRRAAHARAQRRRRRPRRRAGSTAARPARGHFVKMVHNGIEYGMMAAYAEGLNLLRARQRRQRRARGRRGDDAAARPRALPLRHRHGEGRRGLAARHRRALAGCSTSPPRRSPTTRRSGISRAASRTPARGAGRRSPRSTPARRRRC